MTYDLPYVSYVALYIMSLHLINISSKSSTHWRLNLDERKIISITAPLMETLSKKEKNHKNEEEDNIFNILRSTGIHKGYWIKKDTENDDCKINKNSEEFKTSNIHYDNRGNTINRITSKSKNNFTESANSRNDFLNCGKKVNFTYYDHLVGVSNRHLHPHLPEPEVAMLFRKKNSKISEVDMHKLEKKLKKALQQNSSSADVYNQIGNFWRIKGNTQQSIECFRKALALSPTDPNVLLNLARVLYNLQYLDDAIFLARQSLEMLSPEENSWFQHFTLGEILKAYGNNQEAIRHFQYAIDLNPAFQPAIAHLKEMQSSPDTSVHFYTIFIIVILVLGVSMAILSSMDNNSEDISDMKSQRHFNRAMAMKSIRMGMTPRLSKSKKLQF